MALTHGWWIGDRGNKYKTRKKERSGWGLVGWGSRYSLLSIYTQINWLNGWSVPVHFVRSGLQWYPTFYFTILFPPNITVEDISITCCSGWRIASAYDKEDVQLLFCPRLRNFLLFETRNTAKLASWSDQVLNVYSLKHACSALLCQLTCRNYPGIVMHCLCCINSSTCVFFSE